MAAWLGMLEQAAIYLVPVAQVTSSSVALLLTSHSKSRHPPSDAASSSSVARGAHALNPGRGSGEGSGSGEGAVYYQYSTVVVNVLVELVKLVVCLSVWAWVVHRGKSWGARWAALRAEVSWQSLGRWCVPSVTYALENAVRFQVLKLLRSPVTYVLFGHVEILFVAGLTHTVLGRRLSRVRWAAVVLLLNGVISSQLAVCAGQHGGGQCDHLDEFPLGAISLVLLCAAAAAAASIFCEHLFRRDFTHSLWLQNAQLYTAGLLCNSVPLLLEGRSQGLTVLRSPLRGFDVEVWAIVLAYSCLGLSVSGVVKLHSTVAKVYCAAISIFTTAYFSHLFLDFQMNMPFLMAALTVSISLYLYYCEPGESRARQIDTRPLQGVRSIISKLEKRPQQQQQQQQQAGATAATVAV